MAPSLPVAIADGATRWTTSFHRSAWGIGLCLVADDPRHDRAAGMHGRIVRRNGCTACDATIDVDEILPPIAPDVCGVAVDGVIERAVFDGPSALLIVSLRGVRDAKNAALIRRDVGIMAFAQRRPSHATPIRRRIVDGSSMRALGAALLRDVQTSLRSIRHPQRFLRRILRRAMPARAHPCHGSSSGWRPRVLSLVRRIHPMQRRRACVGAETRPQPSQC